MKQRLSLILVAMLAAIGVQAQVIAYDVQTTTTAYEDITGATVIDLQSTVGKDLSKVLLDADGNISFNAADDVTAFPIGFDFGFDGKTMKYFLLTGDGAVMLYEDQTVSTDIHVLGTTAAANILTAANAENAFGAIVRTGAYGLDDTEISYKLEGAEGQHVLVIQYKNLGWQSNAWNYETEVAKSQIQYRLYEATGNIEMKVSGFKPYDNANVGSYMWMRAGIVGDKNDWLFITQYDANGASSLSQRDANVTYSASQYPADGTTWTFLAPEPCQTPDVAPTALSLFATTTSISGSFEKGSADHFLVLISNSAELTQLPADKTKYAVEDLIGNAIVAAVVPATASSTEMAEFATPDDWEADAATTYYVHVFGYNSLCSAGPLYNATPATASIVTMPAAPAAIAAANVGLNQFELNLTASAAPMLVAITDQQGLDRWGDPAPFGRFGTPAGNYKVGDEIADGGQVVFVGLPVTAELAATKAIADLGAADAAVLSEYAADGLTLTFAQGSAPAAPKYYAADQAARIYVGNTLKIASADKNITKVELTTAGFNWNGSNGLYAADALGHGALVSKSGGNTITVSGFCSKEIAISNLLADGETEGAQLRVVAVSVYTEAEGEPEPVVIDGLVPGKAYFVRAWSADGKGGFSSDYTETTVVTDAMMPWEKVMDETVGYEAFLPGWTKSNDEEWLSQPGEYVYSNITYIENAEEGSVSWLETPYILLGEKGTKLKVELGGTARAGWMASDWTLAEGEKIVFQVTKDGEQYTDVFTIDNTNATVLKNRSMTSFTTYFSEMAGEKVRLRILAKRFSLGQLQIAGIYLDAKGDCEAPFDLRYAGTDGGNCLVEWTPVGKETAWEVSYKAADEEVWSDPVAVSEARIALAGLAGATNYMVRVRALCSETGYSSWSDIFSFKTPYTAPLYIDIAESTTDWAVYAGILSDPTELSPGGDIRLNPSWGGVFNPWGTETYAFLVSPAITLLDQEGVKYEANIDITTDFAATGDTQFAVQVLVLKDSETFAPTPADVIGTIDVAELPAEDLQGTYTLPFTGFTGNVRLAIYAAGTSTGELPWLTFTGVGITYDETTTGIVSAETKRAQTDTVYNLQGVRVSQPTKGLYIKNGKKIFVK